MADGNSKGWTFDTFETWIKATNDERAKAIDAALEAANEKAKAHNDVLGAMKDQSAAFLTKDQAAAQFRAVTTAIIAIAALIGIIAAIFGAIIWSRGTP